MIVMLVLAALPITPAHAAIAVGDAWSLWYAGLASSISAPYLPMSPTDSNRLMLVGISSTVSAASTQTVSVSYGGQSLTVAVGDGPTSSLTHTYLFYLKEADIAMASTTNLEVIINGGTIRDNFVYTAVYTGVNQATTIRDTKNRNTGVLSGTVVAFSSALTVSANDRAVEIINLDRVGNSTAATISTWAANWSATHGPDSISDGPNNQAYTAYIASDAATGNTTSQHSTGVIPVYSSISGISLIAATTTVGDGTSPANKMVKAGAVNQAVDAFTLAATGADTIIGLVVTGTNTGNVGPVAIWLDDGSVPNEYDAGDHLVSGEPPWGTFIGNTATFSGLSIPVSTTPTQYIITYDIIGSPTNGQTLKGYVSSVTGSNILINNDNYDATLTIDTTAPFVNSVLVHGPLEVDVNFSEAMGSGVLNPLNYTLSGSGQGTLLGNPDSVALAIGNTYRLTWNSGEMFKGGDIIITVNTAVQDLAGNALVPPVFAQDLGHAIGYPPMVLMTSPTTPAPSTNISPIPVTVTFVDSHTSLNEDVTGFTSSDIVPTNGTVSAFVPVSGAIYTFNLTPSGQGLVSADIGAGVAQDLAGNLNLEATTFSRVYDSIPPTVHIGAPSKSITNTGPVDFPITISGASTIHLLTANVLLHATGTAAGTVTVLNGTSAAPTVRISGITGDGQLDISIVAGIASDAAGNTSAADGPSTAFTVDNTRPVVSIGAPSASTTRIGPVTFQVTVSGAYTVNLLTGNITLNRTGTANGSVAVVPFTGTTSTPIVQVSSITGDGTLGISIAAGIAVDAAGNTSLAVGPSATFTVDNTRPVVSIGAPTPLYTRNSDVTFPITVSGADTFNLLDSQITVLHLTGTTTGTASVDSGGTTDHPVVRVTGITGSGTLGISLAEGFALDTAGNKNAVTNSPIPVIVIADSTAPETTILTKPPLLDNTLTPTFTFIGDDGTGSDVSGVASFMCSLDLGPYAACTSPFTTPSLLDGWHYFYVYAIDNVGNFDTTPDSYAWYLDSLAPNVVSITRADPNPTLADSVDFTVIFSEDVTGVNTSDFALTTTGPIAGYSVTGVMYGPKIYLVTVNTGSGGGTLRLDIPDTATIYSSANPGHGLSGLPYTAGEAYFKPIFIFLPLLFK